MLYLFFVVVLPVAICSVRILLYAKVANISHWHAQNMYVFLYNLDSCFIHLWTAAYIEHHHLYFMTERSEDIVDICVQAKPVFVHSFYIEGIWHAVRNKSKGPI